MRQRMVAMMLLLMPIVSNYFAPSVIADDNLLSPQVTIAETVDTQKPIEEPADVSQVFVANVSWYTASADECGSDSGITASGKVAVAGRTVAADHLPLGTRLRINGNEYVVEDRFGGGYTDRVDIFCNSKEEAFANGRQYLTVEVLD